MDEGYPDSFWSIQRRNDSEGEGAAAAMRPVRRGAEERWAERHRSDVRVEATCRAPTRSAIGEPSLLASFFEFRRVLGLSAPRRATCLSSPDRATPRSPTRRLTISHRIGWGWHASWLRPEPERCSACVHLRLWLWRDLCRVDRRASFRWPDRSLASRSARSWAVRVLIESIPGSAGDHTALFEQAEFTGELIVAQAKFVGQGTDRLEPLAVEYLGFENDRRSTFQERTHGTFVCHATIIQRALVAITRTRLAQP